MHDFLLPDRNDAFLRQQSCLIMYKVARKQSQEDTALLRLLGPRLSCLDEPMLSQVMDLDRR